MALSVIGQLISKAAQHYQLAPPIIAAVIHQESRGNIYATRYEPVFYEKYLKGKQRQDLPGMLPNPGLVSRYTELNCRAISWGLMQILGNTARLYGFKGLFLSELMTPEVNIDLGSRILADCAKKTSSPQAMLLKWNGGGNPKYPGEVLNWMNKGLSDYLLT